MFAAEGVERGNGGADGNHDIRQSDTEVVESMHEATLRGFAQQASGDSAAALREVMAGVVLAR
jgi:hypothetical protein